MDDKQFYEDDDIIIDLGKFRHNFFKGIQKTWLMALFLSIICAIITALFFSITYTPMYKAKVSFTIVTSINSNDQDNEKEFRFDYNQYTASLMADSFPYILDSSAMQDVLKKEMGTDVINGSITATAIENTNIFTVEVESNIAEDAYDIVNAIIINYSEVAKYVIGDTKLNIIQDPVMPKAPHNLFYLSKYLGIGFLIGLIVWLIVLIIYSFMRNTIYRESDIQEQLNKYLFGVLPIIKRRYLDKSGLFTLDSFDVGSNYRENINTIATRVVNDAKKSGDKVLLVTSTLPGEGKSSTVVSLAMALGQRGYSVLLIDADLYQNNLHRYLKDNRDNVYGLVDFFEGKVSAKDIIYSCDKMNCDVISGNSEPKCSTAMIFNSKKVKLLLTTLEKKYDYVLIDTPSCGVLSDVTEISRYADSAIFIIRRDVASVTYILETMQNLYDSGIRISGCILNGVIKSTEGYKKYEYGKYMNKNK